MIIRITSVNIFNITRKIMRKIYTKTFVYFAEIQYIYSEINNRNIIMHGRECEESLSCA